MVLHRHRFRLPVAGIVLAIVFTSSLGSVGAAEAPRVTSFTLINADTDRPVPGYSTMSPNATLNLATLPTRNLNIRVNTGSGVRSVRIALNGGTSRMENNPPYAVAGDDRGNFRAWSPTAGAHTVTATAFGGRNGGGAAGAATSIRFTVVNTSTPTSNPDPQPPQPPPSSSSPSQCGPMPSSAPTGWQRVMSDSFDENIPLGEWGRPGGRWEEPGGNWRARPAGYRDSSGRGTYNSMKTTSQHDGLLDVWIHSEGATRYVAAPMPLIGDRYGQRISICMRADVIPGYKLAFLLWPTMGEGNERGEIDYPEGRLLGPGTSAHAFMHYDPEPASGKKQDAYDSGVTLQGWHEYTIAWRPQSGYCEFYLDGRLIGRSTRFVPSVPMRYVMQIETFMSGQALPAPAEGHVLIDWVTIDVPR